MIYTNILKLCEQHNIAVSKLEKETGMGNATIRGWENSSPTVEKLGRVAKYFGVTIDELMKEENHGED